MKEYLALLRKARTEGELRANRTQTPAYSLFGYQLRLDLAAGFPLLTTKRLHFRAIAYELLWFLRGETNVDFLKRNDVSIWDEWADEKGELGPVYGKQWRAWGCADGSCVDQIDRLIKELQTNPWSRRLMVSAWNVGELDAMALQPCHVLFQFYVSGGRLSCHVYQRSADVFLGVPFNLASYSLLVFMLSQVVGLKPGELIYSFGDVHLYENHLVQADEQLLREPRPLPQLSFNPRIKNLFAFRYEDMEITDYDPLPPIKARVAI